MNESFRNWSETLENDLLSFFADSVHLVKSLAPLIELHFFANPCTKDFSSGF
jgi:hypothetical protein